MAEPDEITRAHDDPRRRSGGVRPATPRRRWAVLIGINGYHQSLGALPFCVQDAKLLRDTLVSEACGFPPDNVLLLCDDAPPDRQPTYGNIHSWLAAWLSRPAADDLVVLYFAGHSRQIDTPGSARAKPGYAGAQPGNPDLHRDGGRTMLAPLDATLDSLGVTGIPISTVRGLLDRCAAARKVLILDACHSGAGRDVVAMPAGFRAELDAGKGLYTIASCDRHQISYDWPEKRHGVFTYYLAEAIARAAPANAAGVVTMDAVYDWTYRKVREWTAGKRMRQEPVRICDVQGDIPIAVRRFPARAGAAAAAADVRQTPPPHAHGQRVPAEVPEWTEWLDGRGPHNWRAWSGAAVRVWLLGAALAAFVGGYTRSFAAGGLVFAAFAGIPLVAWRGAFGAWRNRYRLHCAEVCRGAGDYLGGAQHALAMGRRGVDRSAAAAVIAGLAKLAIDRADRDCARRLYRRGWKRWRSPHARRGLKALKA